MARRAPYLDRPLHNKRHFILFRAIITNEFQKMTQEDSEVEILSPLLIYNYYGLSYIISFIGISSCIACLYIEVFFFYNEDLYKCFLSV